MSTGPLCAATDGPAPREICVGRAQVLREIASFLAANQSVSLVGLPGMGKSVLLRHLARPATLAALIPDSAMLCAFLDCAELQESAPAEVFRRFAAALTEALAVHALPVEPVVAAAVAQPSRLAFEAALRRLNGRGLQVVLALDTFEALSNASGLGVPFFNALRAAAGRFKLSFLTASDRPLYALTDGEWSHELLSSPFFNIFASIVLGPLPESEARHLIRVLLRAYGALEPATLEDALYALAGGYPPALSIVCRQAAAWPGACEEVAQRAKHELRSWYAAVWQCLTPAERALLHRCAGGDGALPAGPGDRALLQGLVRKGLLADAGGGAYHLIAQAWARFIDTLASA